jgi:hypothetical protein
MATRQISAAKGLSLSENARALALIMMGINDSLVASFYNKYHYNLWRPETGIRNGSADGNTKTNGDPGFATFIPTPCFRAIRRITQRHQWRSRGHEASLRRRRSRHHDHEHVPALGSLPATTITLHYSQLKAIADDVDDARVYGGIHWRFDQDGGNVLGRAVATAVVKNNLRPVHP